MDANRYIPIWVAVDGDKLYMPHELTFEKQEHGSNYYMIKGIPYYDSNKFYKLECRMWDTKNNCVKPTRSVEIKVEPEKRFYIGKTVYVSRRLNTLREDKLVDIEYNRDHCDINTATWKKIKQNYGYYSKLVTEAIDDKELVEFVILKPVYVFESGYKTEYTHEMYVLGEIADAPI